LKFQFMDVFCLMLNSLFCVLKLFYSCQVSKSAAEARIRRGQLDDRKLFIFEVEVVPVDVVL
jgi:hypothetical protein